MLLTPKPRPSRCIWLLGAAVRIPRMPKDSSRPVASGSRAVSPTAATVPGFAHATTRPPREASRSDSAGSLPPGASLGPWPGRNCMLPRAPLPPLDRACIPPQDVAHPAIRNSLALVRSPNTPDQRRGVSAILPALPKLLTPKPRPVRCIWLLGSRSFSSSTSSPRFAFCSSLALAPSARDGSSLAQASVRALLPCPVVARLASVASQGPLWAVASSGRRLLSVVGLVVEAPFSGSGPFVTGLSFFCICSTFGPPPRYLSATVCPTPQISGGAFQLFHQPCRCYLLRSPAPSAASGCWVAPSSMAHLSVRRRQ